MTRNTTAANLRWLLAIGDIEDHANGCVLEYRFHPVRRWRFDIAWPDDFIAIEIDGLVYGGRGGHQSHAGATRDREKIYAANLLGWAVCSLTTRQWRAGCARGWLEVWQMRQRHFLAGSGGG